jgi:hypothetical protein
VSLGSTGITGTPASWALDSMTFDSGTVAPVEQVLYNPNNPLQMEWAGVFIANYRGGKSTNSFRPRQPVPA